MNLCFVTGRIINEIQFEFIINSQKNSIAYFDIELLNKSIIKVKAYDEIADYCYKELNNSDVIFIHGKLNENGEIIVQVIEKWEK